MAEKNTFEKIKDKVLNIRWVAFGLLAFICAVGFSNGFDSFTKVFNFFNQGSSVEVIDVVVNESIPSVDRPNLIDLRLQNTGNKLAVIKNVHLEIEHIWELKNIPLSEYSRVSRGSSALSSTGDYKVQLPRVIDKLDKPTQVDTPHQIKGGEADRFTVNFTHDAYLSYVYQIKGWVTYDDDKVSRFPRDLIVLISQNYPLIPKFYVDSKNTSFQNILNNPTNIHRDLLYVGNPDDPSNPLSRQVKKSDLMLRDSDLIRWANMSNSSRIKEIERITSAIPENRELIVDLLQQSVNNYLHNKAVLLEIANTLRKSKVTSGSVLRKLITVK